MQHYPNSTCALAETTISQFQQHHDLHAAPRFTSLTLPYTMSRITPVSAKKRKLEEAMRGKTSKPRKRIRKQKHYHSSSDESEADSDQDVGFAPVDLGDSDQDVIEPAAAKKQKTSKKQTAHDVPEPVRSKAEKTEKSKKKERSAEHKKKGKTTQEEETEEAAPIAEEEEQDAPDHVDAEDGAESAQPSGSEDEEEQGDDSDSSASSASETTSTTKRTKPKSKRNDPEAFSTSISKILGTKLPTSQRSDPVLSRSADAAKSRSEATNARLDKKALARLRGEKLAARQKGRTTDVLGIERGIAGDVAEKEKQLRKIATRGVIQLFNAFRGAHERAEEARREERKKGTVGMGERERKVGEVSKEGFLELIGGKKKVAEAT